MCFIKPVVYESLFSDDFDCFLKGYVREHSRDVIGYQYVILVDVQVLNLFSEREGNWYGVAVDWSRPWCFPPVIHTGSFRNWMWSP